MPEYQKMCKTMQKPI